MSLSLPHYRNGHVLIVGDVMLDRYWYGRTSRISPEAPVPVVHIQEMQELPGAAANVALNVVAVGSNATLLSMAGEDSYARQLIKLLEAKHIQVELQCVAELPTITKLRVLSQHQQLIRLDFEQGFHEVDPASLMQSYAKNLAKTNVVLLSDYAKGVLKHAPRLIAMAREKNIPIFVDPKGLDFSIYQGATLLTPNRKEFEAVVGKCENDDILVSKGLALIEKLQLQALLITRSEEGMTLIQKHQTPLHIAAKKQEIYDVTGAGDTVIGILAASVAAGASLDQAVVLANLAAGIVVTRLGAASVSEAQLRRALQEDSHDAHRGILNEGQALLAVADARAHQEKIVMTNGCFDILHPGHVAYLEAAKRLGDRLIVAVNDDDSVRRLKGAQRPINPLAHRMSVLAGLSAVDWVVPFSEETPERLIGALLPDVLVKGGDYTPEQIAGGKAVIAHGGEIKILPFVPGCSTSSIIDKIQRDT